MVCSTTCWTAPRHGCTPWSWALSTAARLYERVLGQAFTDAHAKAARLAELSGARLGAVQEVTENSAAARASHYATAASSEPAPLPGGALIEGGRHELTTSVTVTWLLEDA